MVQDISTNQPRALAAYFQQKQKAVRIGTKKACGGFLKKKGPLSIGRPYSIPNIKKRRFLLTLSEKRRFFIRKKDIFVLEKIYPFVLHLSLLYFHLSKSYPIRYEQTRPYLLIFLLCQSPFCSKNEWTIHNKSFGYIFCIRRF
jgi:hypothetical protein